MTPADTRHSPGGTAQASAAARTNIMRAAAPPLRTYSLDSRMPRLPPVEKSPQARLRARFWPGVGYSVVTLAQSQSSSSATSWARPVSVPCPISDRAMRMTTASSGFTTTQALSSSTAPAGAAAVCASGARMPRVKAPAAAETERKPRRESDAIAFMLRPSLAIRTGAGRALDGGLDAVVGTAAADIGDAVADLGNAGLRRLGQQRGGGHDHAGLAVSALRHVQRHPGLLHRVAAIGREPLDGGDLLRLAHRRDWQGAGADGLAVDMHG